MSDRFVKAATDFWNRLERKQWVYGTLGRKNSDGSYAIEVVGRVNFVYVTLRHATGAQTVVLARNDAGIQHAPKLSVKMKLEYGIYVIYGRTGNAEAGVTNPPVPPDGVPAHTHVHANLTFRDADDHTQYHTDARGDARYYTKSEHIDVSVGAADAGKPIILNADGEVDPSMQLLFADEIADAVTDDTIVDADLWGYVTAGVLVKTAWSNVKVVLKAYFDTLYESAGAVATHAALTIAHGATGAVVGTTNSQTLTNKTLDSSNISTLTAKNPPLDADSVVIVDSAASNVFKSVTYTNVKAFLKTYFDTIYGQLAGTNAWTGLNSFTRAGNLSIKRTGANTTDLQASLVLHTVTSGAMANGFGPGILAFAEDSDAVANPTGFFGWVRNGSDTTYSWNLYIFVGGVATLVGNWTSTGLQSPTIVTPTIASFINANHAHQNAAGGGTLTSDAISDMTAFAKTLIAASDAAAARAILSAVGLTGNETVAGVKSFTSTIQAQATPGAPALLMNNNLYLEAKNSSGTDIRIFGLNTLDDVYLGAIDNAGGKVIIREDGANVIVLDGGNVGISTTSSPAAKLQVVGDIALRPGTASDTAKVGGVLFVSTAQVGNVGTGEDDLASYSVPANTLAVNGQSIWFEASGTSAANINAKSLRLYFGTSGTSQLALFGITSAGGGGSWMLRGRIVRTGAATQKGSAMLNFSGGGDPQAAVVTGLNQTLSGAVTLKVTGEATSNNDIVIESFIVGFDDANT